MIEVDLRSLEGLERRLTRLQNPDTRDAIRDLADDSIRQVRRHFDRRRGPDGTPWPPRKDDEPHPLLEKSGRLFRSIGPRSFEKYGFEISTLNVPYATVQQYGDPGRNIPPRPYLGWGEDDDTELGATTDAWLQRYVGVVIA